MAQLETNKPTKVRVNKRRSNENLTGWLFAMPWVIGLLLFFGYPLLSSMYYSFTDFSILQSGEFIGLANYRELFQDDLFWISIYNTIYFAVFFVPLSIIFGVALAMVLNMKVKGMAVY